jgi:hypothetical protein
MCRKLFFFVSFIMLICVSQNLHAETFSIGAVEDITLDNGPRYGPDSSGNGSGLEARDIPDRRHVFLVSYDISSLKGSGQFANVSFSHFSHDQNAETNVYGIIESLDLLEVESLTWNTAPGVQNDPTPALNSPVELDPADLTDVLLTFSGPGSAGMRFSTDTSQALADFLNADTDGIVTFLFAPAAENNQLIVRSSEHSEGGSFLEGEIIPILGIALNPDPADGDVNVVRDVVLEWTPSDTAVSRNLYLGTDFDDVNNAVTGSPLLVGPGLDTSSFDAGRLDFDQTYFWRVDEIDGPPDSTVYKGNVWSFTIESFSITIPEESITATASSNAEGQEPEQTINSSGLDENGLHSTDTATMWRTAEDDAGPIWIQYEFDKPYKLYQMKVWNYNGESILSLFGLKDVTVEYSLDEINWTQLENISEFAQAPGTIEYAANTTVEFEGAAAKYVRINAASIWGSGIFTSDQYGLSEVQFTAIPVAARFPSPDNGATDVAVDVTLEWRAGREADEHNVYISTDEQAVLDGTAPIQTVSQTSNGPLSLDLENTYFWKIDEVNNVNETPIWEGNTWSFSTQAYLVVEDFESYNDIAEGEEGSNLVYLTWIDGFDNPATNGSTMGYFEAFEPTMETNTVVGGNQSAPLFYNNTSASISEVVVDTANLAVGGDWTLGSPETLVINVHGDPGNNTATDRMYVKVNNSKVIFDGDISRPDWMQWNIDLAALGISLSNVTELTIGFERIGGTGGSGMVFLDEIRLYRNAPPVPEEEMWVEAETGTVTAPMMKYDDPTASGGQYVSTVSGTADEGTAPPFPDGTVTIPFTIESGTYTARFRVGFPGGDDSCWVRIQGATITSPVDASGWIHFNDIPTGDYWHWSQEVKSEDEPGEPPVEFTMEAGTYNLEISYRGADLRIDVIVFSKVEE